MVRKGDPWFDDGNILLLVEDGICFRVHRGVLARQSDMFDSMLSIPTPPLASSATTGDESLREMEILEGCQTVQMYDKAVELANLLKAIYDGVTFQSRDIEDFFILSSILRLATKYLIASLRIRAVKALTETWSYTLEGHDAMVLRSISGSESEAELTYPFVHPLHVLNLARETDVQVIVPSALYFLSLYPYSSFATGEHPKLKAESVTGLQKPSSQLSFEDLGNYTLMYQFRITYMLDFCRILSKQTSSRYCVKRLNPDEGDTRTGAADSTIDPCGLQLARLTSQTSRSWVSRTGPLYWLTQVLKRVEDNPDLCRECKKAITVYVENARITLWDHLPGIVGLGSWRDLWERDLFEPQNIS